MRVQFYKPNAKVTGSACSFWTSEDGSIMSSLIKQDSWDDARKRGSFSKNKDNPNKKVIIKYIRSIIEISLKKFEITSIKLFVKWLYQKYQRRK